MYFLKILSGSHKNYCSSRKYWEVHCANTPGRLKCSEMHSFRAHLKLHNLSCCGLRHRECGFHSDISACMEGGEQQCSTIPATAWNHGMKPHQQPYSKGVIKTLGYICIQTSVPARIIIYYILCMYYMIWIINDSHIYWLIICDVCTI